MRSVADLNRLLSVMDVAVRDISWRMINAAYWQPAASAGAVMLGYVTDGTVSATLSGRAARRCAAGSMFLIPAGKDCQFSTDSGGSLAVATADVRISGSSLFDRVKVPIFADLSGSPLVRHNMEELVRLGSGELTALGEGPLADSMMKTCILALLQDFFSRPGIDLKIVSALADDRLAPVIAIVLERPDGPHSPKSLAALAGLSRSTFTRVFQEAMGQSPSGFIVRTRLFHAAEMLRTSKAPIKSIAIGAGFQSRSHFSRAFRHAYGVDPTAYRRHLLPEPQTPVPQDLSLIQRAKPTAH